MKSYRWGSGLLRITLGYSPVLRAERSAATLRFARNTGGQVCKTLQSDTSRNSDGFKTSGAECDADAAGWHIPVAQDDLDLIKLIRLWSALPAEIRSGIMLIASSC
jgi:hypothetical protein